jgi:hypothetical protein
MTPGAVAAILLSGVVAYWGLTPKSSGRLRVPGWAILPLALSFVFGAYAVGLAGTADRHLLPGAYGALFVLWIQLGLWLTSRRRGSVSR